MGLKTVVFIDGQNFGHSLRNFRFQSDPPIAENVGYQLDEKHFDWEKFLRGALEKFDEALGQEHLLVRAYWYNAGELTSFSPNITAAERIIHRNPKIAEAGVRPSDIIDAARNWHERESNTFYNRRRDALDRIQLRSNFIEFKYVGQYRVAPYHPYRIDIGFNGELIYQGTKHGEKGVDVGMAVDMIAKMPQLDAAVIVSGDADFIPAVRHLKDNLKYVYSFSVAEGAGRTVHWPSTSLNRHVDCFRGFDEIEMLGEYLSPQSSIPFEITKAINSRIDNLREQNERGGPVHNNPHPYRGGNQQSSPAPIGDSINSRDDAEGVQSFEGDPDDAEQV